MVPDGTLMSVPILSRQPLEFGQPTALFQFATPSRECCRRTTAWAYNNSSWAWGRQFGQMP